IAEDAPSADVEIDLAEQLVTAPNFQAHFPIDPFEKHRLANGLDQIALTLQHADAIDAYEADRPGFKPVLTD
ncbi:MAG: 3-isopropylmalate dehydratase small subunit, partial [Acidimicrobiia bacterium]|nr:3-isopropylmalate dehydratase small subunit [Acidimicrobiia bacterium]